MKALVFNGPQNIVYEDFPEPKIEENGDIIIAVQACSICGSDLHIYHGGQLGPHNFQEARERFCVGHETIGEVVEVGAGVKNYKVGDRVMVAPGTGCGKCAACLNGQIELCVQAKAGPMAYGMSAKLNGGQAQYMRVPLADLFAQKIPDGVNDEQAVLLVDALATGYSGVKHTQLKQGETVAVIGLGPVGLMAVESCMALGAEQVFAIDPVTARREKAKSLGAIALSPEEANEIIMQKTSIGVDCVVEAVGHEKTINQALVLSRSGGRVSVMGMMQGDFLIPAPLIQGKGIQFYAGIASTIAHWPILGSWLQEGKIKGEGMFSHCFSLADGAEAYAKLDAREDDCLKIMIKP